MGKIERRIFFTVLAVLVVSIGMMLLQSAAGTGTPKVYHVAVLLDGSGNDYWRNFRRGVEQAALKSNADVRFVTRYEGEAGPAQVDALRQEWQGETDGAVVIPIDGGLLAAGLQEARAGWQTVIVGVEPDSDKVGALVSADNAEMGAKLAEAIAAGGEAGCTVYQSAAGGAASQQRYDALVAGLAALGIPCEAVRVEGELPEKLPGEGALCALEPGLAESLCARDGTAGRVYGMGSSNRLLHDLEEGRAAALVVQNDYEAGYLSLLRLVGALNGRPQSDATLECYTVTAENMFTDPIDQILFPIG